MAKYALFVPLEATELFSGPLQIHKLEIVANK